jgi:hypothetical protein
MDRERSVPSTLIIIFATLEEIKRISSFEAAPID